MINKIIAKSELSLQVEESNNVLLDESDQIIGDLKSELAQLKEQLLRYEKVENPQPPPLPLETPPSEDVLIQLEIKKHQITSLIEKEKVAKHRHKIIPHVVDNLQKPIAQMTSDLEKLIESVQDSSVKETLSQCVNVIEDVKKLSEKTELLNQELNPNKQRVDLLSFFRKIALEKNEASEEGIKLYASAQLPKNLYIDQNLFKRSILILLKEISRLSSDTISIKLKQGTEMVYDISVEQLRVSLFGETPWDLPAQEEMETYLENTLENTENWGLDLLYAKKVVEKHGGSLSFHREEQDVVGFDVEIPVEKK